MGEHPPSVLSRVRPAAFPTSKPVAEEIGPIVSNAAAAALFATTQVGSEELSVIAAPANAAQPEPR